MAWIYSVESEDLPSHSAHGSGLKYRVDRIRGLGNAVVPAQAREAFKRLVGLNIS